MQQTVHFVQMFFMGKGQGYAALPQMTGRDFSYAYFVFPRRYRTPDKQCGPGRYRGLTAFASLSMVVSDGDNLVDCYLHKKPCNFK